MFCALNFMSIYIHRVENANAAFKSIVRLSPAGTSALFLSNKNFNFSHVLIIKI